MSNSSFFLSPCPAEQVGLGSTALALALTICFQTLPSPPEGTAPERAHLLLRGTLVLAVGNEALPHLPVRGSAESGRDPETMSQADISRWPKVAGR